MSFPLSTKLYGAPELLNPGVKPIGTVAQDLSHPLSYGLVSRWLFNEGAGDTSYDLIGENHGTLTSGASWSVDPLHGPAVNLDGANDYISVAEIPLLNTSFTLSAWVRANSFGVNEGVITRTEPSPSKHNYYLNIKNGSDGWQFGFYDSAGSTWREVRTTDEFTTGQLVWLAGTWDNDTKRMDLYVNGISRINNTFASAIPNDAGTTKIGRGAGSSEVLDGFIGDTRIYARALSAAEIIEIYFDSYKDLIPSNSGIWIPKIAAGVVAINQVAETDLSQSITSAKNKSVSLNTEVDLAQIIGVAKTKSLGQNNETDISQTITPNKTKPLGQVIETNLAQPITVSGSKIIAVNQVTETDTAQIITAAKTKAIGLNAEIDLAQLTTSLKTLSIGLNTETDLAQSIGVGKTVQIGQATETDFAQIIAPAGNKIISVNQVIETDLAQVATTSKAKSISQISELDAALGSAAVKGLAVNQILESDSAFGISSDKLRSVAQVLESDLAQPITGVRTQVVSLGQVVEVDFPQSFSILKSKGLLQVTEIDLAQPITLSGPLVEPGCITANISLDAAITATPDICP